MDINTFADISKAVSHAQINYNDALIMYEKSSEYAHLSVNRSGSLVRGEMDEGVEVIKEAGQKDHESLKVNINENENRVSELQEGDELNIRWTILLSMLRKRVLLIHLSSKLQRAQESQILNFISVFPPTKRIGNKKGLSKDINPSNNGGNVDNVYSMSRSYINSSENNHNNNNITLSRHDDKSVSAISSASHLSPIRSKTPFKQIRESQSAGKVDTRIDTDDR
jgi:hypothetical protein